MYAKTTFPKIETAIKINPQDGLYTCGSCFANEFYERLSVRRFNVLPHPFGIVFNPISIAQQFEFILSGYSFQQSDLAFHNGLYLSLNHHGSFSGSNPDQVLQHMNNQIHLAHQNLNKLDTLILTLGSAHYYEYTATQKIVANCHKLPQNQFKKKRASTEEITERLSSTFQKLHEFNPKLKIILTISPVRYLRDGFSENSISKASLIIAADQLKAMFSFVHYFPAYEIFMDDLRDYRYVKEDLVHPNKAAIDYIWSYFYDSFFSEESKKLISQLNRFYQLAEHKVMNPFSTEFQSYLENLKSKLNLLQHGFPNIDFTNEEKVYLKLKSAD